MSEINIELKVFEKHKVLRKRTKDSLWAMGKYIGQLYKDAKRLNLKPAGPMYTIYYEEPTNPKSVDYEMVLPVTGETDGFDEIGGEKCVYTRVKGSYKQFPEAYGALSSYVESHGLKMSAPPREVYIKGPLLGFITFIPVMVTDIYFPLES